jgi:hypothetical protein
MMRRFLGLILLAAIGHMKANSALLEPETFWGMCDASAGIALDDSHFVVADDESNILRIYKRGEANPIREHDFSKFLEAKRGETDLEGAARVGNRIYWISSHGRDRQGRPAPKRQRFFATDIHGKSGLKLEHVGKPCESLLTDLFAETRFARHGFAEASLISPKQPGGLNIEGMCARPDGSLLIGFRNPVPAGKGLLVPLLNPNDVIEGVRAKFGDVIELDLGGFGVRDISPAGGDKYLIIAGSREGAKTFRLYSWNGARAEQIPGDFFTRLNPEAIFRFENDAPGVFQILSDDGGKRVSGVECKDLPEESRRFRAGEIHLDLK